MNSSAPLLSHLDATGVDDETLTRMVRSDQLTAVHRSVTAGMPVSMVMSFTTALVALNSGRGFEGACWLLLSLSLSAWRFIVSRRALACSPELALPSARDVERQLRTTARVATLAGCVWALVPLLCDGYTSPQTLFYLTVVCGTCAGAVTYGYAYARTPISFIVPNLLSVAGCLVYAGGFDRLSLAAMVLLYLAGLVRGARFSEKVFEAGSRLRNEATTLAARLSEAHASLQQSTRQLAHRVSHDLLTGLLNREGFTQAVVADLAAHPGHAHAVLLLDLDGFKAVNDAFGHKVGDIVLQDVAAWLQRELAGLRVVQGRWGGDEFALFYTPQGASPSPEALAEALIRSASSATTYCAGYLGMSIGISKFDGADVVDFTDMVSFADEALYEAKRAGRNRHRVVDDALNLRLATRRDVERDLMQAIASRAIELWYQPILERESGRIHSLEALMRWKHPRHGYVSPEHVVFAAASTGVAEPLLRHILDEICLAIVHMDTSGSALAGVPIAMNVSPREMAQLAVDELVLGTLQKRGIAAQRLQIEITEEVALDTHAARGRLDALSAAGVAIVIDDFGVGYSSLASLRSEHVRQVKIDRSFIDGLAGSPGNQVLVNSVVQIGRSLNIQVVAEGVETRDELAVLDALDCALVQGYLFARPAPLSDVVAWAERRSA